MNLESRFHAIDFAAIRGFVDTQEQEHLHLDFKLLPENGRIGRNERKTLSKVVSGFANSSGGICVWGVDARKNEDGIDTASRLCPIADVNAVRSQFESLTGEAASPIVDGILHKCVLQDDTSGFLATLVPESDTGPHMAKLGEDRYYKRSGDSFYRMEHFDIADMFGRRRKPIPVLRILPLPAAVASQPEMVGCRWVVGIENVGRSVLKYPYLEISVDPPYEIDRYGLDGNSHTGLDRVRESSRSLQRCVFAGAVNDVVHINTLKQVTRIAPTGPWREAEGPSMHLTIVLGGEDVEPIVQELTIPWHDLVQPTTNAEG